MTDIDTLTIAAAREAIQRGKEIEKLIGGQSPLATATSSFLINPQIAILDRGFVYVGTVSVEGDWVLITDAKNVRRWGTTKGLGQLANDGPLKDTVLDPAGIVRVPLRALIGLIQCEASSWTK